VKGETGGLVEKSRDMGATWLAVSFSVWLFLFVPGATVGWGSRKEALVDRIACRSCGSLLHQVNRLQANPVTTSDVVVVP
jgi:hypothetical protein